MSAPAVGVDPKRSFSLRRDLCFFRQLSRQSGRAAPTIVLLHGLGFQSFQVRRSRRCSSGWSSNCFAFDFRCHGRSEGPRGLWRLADLVDDATRVLDLQERQLARSASSATAASSSGFIAASDARVARLVASGAADACGGLCGHTGTAGASRAAETREPVHASPRERQLVEPQLPNPDPTVMARVKGHGLISDARRLAPSTCEDLFAWNALEAASRLAIPAPGAAATQASPSAAPPGRASSRGWRRARRR